MSKTVEIKKIFTKQYYLYFIMSIILDINVLNLHPEVITMKKNEVICRLHLFLLDIFFYSTSQKTAVNKEKK